MVAEREGNGGDELHTAFHCHSHSAGVMGVDRGIVAMVDTTDDHVGSAPATELAQGNLHTVNRSAAARPHLKVLTFATEFETKRGGCREGARESAAGRFGGTNNQISHARKHFNETAQTLGMIAVII